MADLDPYAEALGFERVVVDGETLVRLQAREDVLGRPGFLHGGVIGALLEAACHEAFHGQEGDAPAGARPVNLSINYVRGARLDVIYAAGQVIRQGKRVSHIDATAWQEDRKTPVATARMHFLTGPR